MMPIRQVAPLFGKVSRPNFGQFPPPPPAAAKFGPFYSKPHDTRPQRTHEPDRDNASAENEKFVLINMKGLKNARRASR